MITPKDYVGALIQLSESRRGEFVDMQFLTEARTTLTYNIPLAEVSSFSLQRATEPDLWVFFLTQDCPMLQYLCTESCLWGPSGLSEPSSMPQPSICSGLTLHATRPLPQPKLTAHWLCKCNAHSCQNPREAADIQCDHDHTNSAGFGAAGGDRLLR